MTTADALATHFYHEEWDTCQPTRTIALLAKLIEDARSSARSTAIEQCVAWVRHEEGNGSADDLAKDMRRG